MLFLINKKFIASIVSLFLLFVFIMPVLSHAQSSDFNGPVQPLKGIVTCDGSAEHPCNFDSLVSMINGIIKWIIGIAGVIFTISCIYGGFLYMTSGENPGNKAKAKSILYDTLIGFIIILVSWLIVYTILHTLAPGNDSILQFIGG
jgi:hypothetical protein